MVGVVGLLLSLSVLVTSALVALRDMARRTFAATDREIPVADVSGQCVLASVVLHRKLPALRSRCSCWIYRLLPRAEVTWRDTFPGAFLGGLLWEIAKYIFAWSLNYFHYDQIYGSWALWLLFSPGVTYQA